MHDFLIALAFVAMVTSPALVKMWIPNEFDESDCAPQLDQKESSARRS